MSAEKKKYLTLEEVSDLLGVNYQLIYRLVRAGELPAIRLGRVFRVTEEDLEAYLEAKKTTVGGTCAACGKRYKSNLSLDNQCVVCARPICKDCWVRKGVRRCKEHEEQEK